ncbi:MAG: thiamine-phosphate kinase [Planctomycetaceae bacterium]
MSAAVREFEYIDWVRSQVKRHPRVPLGIGDDTALVRFQQPTDCLVTVDMLMEGVHFKSPPATPRQIGRKAVAVNLSDIAAMAGRPLAAVVSVALSRDKGFDFAKKLHAGIQELADEFDVAIAGGDTNSWDGPLVFSVTVLGEATERGVVRRSGAQADDWIMVTGTLGGSLAGKHLSFQPRVHEALLLHEAVDLHAMIDISDGLSADLSHILDSSGMGCGLYENRIPISDAARTAADGRSPLEHALSDGEDFELLFTVAPQDGARLLGRPPMKVQLSHIGIITAGPASCLLIASDESSRPLPRAGWVHDI